MNLYLYLKHFPALGQKLTGGTDKAVHGLASGLAACGAQVTVLCEGPEDSFLQAKEGYGVHCFATDRRSPVFAVSESLKGYVRHLMPHDLVILNGIFHPGVFGLSRLLHKRQIPYVVAPHDPYHPSIFRKNPHLKWPYWYLVERRMLRQARAVQALDGRHAQWLRRLGVNTPVVEIPNGFAPDEVGPERPLRRGETGVTRLFYLGRLDSHHKGLDLLIDATADLTDTGALRLAMQGPDGGDRRHLEARAARLQLGDRTSFLDPDYTRPAPEIIGNYDIFCLPSRFDGFGLSALEAMLAGRVLLVSEASGIAPHVWASGCGVVVQPEVQSIRQGLRELLQRRPKWNDMGRAGRRYVLTHLQWEALARRALNRYQDLAAAGT
jgi:glycosyltransferase involved in cell wall biosynthesis